MHAVSVMMPARLPMKKLPAMIFFSKKMTGMEADLEKYKDLQEQYKELQDKFSALQSQLNESKLRAEIDKERAVMDKEREMQERIREADRENAKLQAKIEQLSPAEASPK